MAEYLGWSPSTVGRRGDTSAAAHDAPVLDRGHPREASPSPCGERLLTRRLTPEHRVDDLAELDRSRRTVLRRAGGAAHAGLAPVVAGRIVPGGIEVDLVVPEDAQPATRPGDLQGFVALFAPVARALAVVHDAGGAIGGIDEGALWCRATDGAGVLVAAGTDPSPADDAARFLALMRHWWPAGNDDDGFAAVVGRMSGPHSSIHDGGGGALTMAEVSTMLARLAARASGPDPLTSTSTPMSPPAARRGVAPHAMVAEPPMQTAPIQTAPIQTAPIQTARGPGRHAQVRQVVGARGIASLVMGPRVMGPREMGPREMGPREMGSRMMGASGVGGRVVGLIVASSLLSSALTVTLATLLG